MVSALEHRSSGRRVEPGLCRHVVSSEETLNTLPLFTEVYKWVPVITKPEGNLRMD